jgi:hypothetical protein
MDSCGMTKAIVDTTVLVNILLKSGETHRSAAAALASFDETELPVYAIKEFSAGALQNFVWLHNKFVQTKSSKKTIGMLRAVSRTPKRYLTSTALEALEEAMAAAPETNMTPKELYEMYGDDAAKIDEIQADSYRLELKTRILDAWSRRRAVTTSIIEELECYPEKDPNEKMKILSLNSNSCRGECAIARRLLEFPSDLEKVIEVLKKEQGQEAARRHKALKDLKRKPKAQVTRNQCRNFGDAVFCILAPADSSIITLNGKDFRPLAQVLGKAVVVP